jgi:hypothetical protein
MCASGSLRESPSRSKTISSARLCNKPRGCVRALNQIELSFHPGCTTSAAARAYDSPTQAPLPLRASMSQSGTSRLTGTVNLSGTIGSNAPRSLPGLLASPCQPSRPSHSSRSGPGSCSRSCSPASSRIRSDTPARAKVSLNGTCAPAWQEQEVHPLPRKLCAVHRSEFARGIGVVVEVDLRDQCRHVCVAVGVALAVGPEQQFLWRARERSVETLVQRTSSTTGMPRRSQTPSIS